MRLGIDLGGTKTEIIALDSRNGAELYRKRVASPRDSYSDTITTITSLILEAEQKLERTGSIGIGMPGAISPRTGLIKNANSTWLNGHALDQDLSAMLQRPVRLQNDANCFAVSEAVDGAAAGARIVFGVIMGTGCGGGIAIDGAAWSGHNAIGGEWGHNPLPWPTPSEAATPLPCYCGQSGCIERWISGTGFVEDYQRLSGNAAKGHDIITLARAGDMIASTALRHLISRTARALAGIINILDPDVIVLGGGLSNIAELYSSLPDEIEKWCFSDAITTPIVPAKYGDSSGVRGAAWLWGKTG